MSLVNLRKKIRYELNERTDVIALGGCTDFAGYQRAVGVIEGLGVAERLLLDVMEEMKNEEFED